MQELSAMRLGGVMGAGAAAYLALSACASVPPSDAGTRRDAAPQPDAGRPIGGRDADPADGAVIEPDPVDAGRPDGGGGPIPLMNEFVADHAGNDLCEFVEIIGTPSTDFGDYSILVVEGDAGMANPGSVDVAIPVGATDDAGLWVTAPLSGQIENGSMTLLLVSGFAGGSVDLDGDDDGTVDLEPWSQLVDAVAVSDGGVADVLYAGGAVLDPSFDGVDFSVGGASRIPDGVDTDGPRDWVRNDFDGEGLGCGTGTPVPGEAFNTPGSPNRPVAAP
ncbi:MAG TPA: hypothetical protein VKB80_34270 [Kofleriaceae bacterium]|nr:hypothetical protein [Kofleriaceae bacterium]